jgi:hypothetical protein
MSIESAGKDDTINENEVPTKVLELISAAYNIFIEKGGDVP